MTTSTSRDASPISSEPKTTPKTVPWSPWVAVVYAVIVYFVAQFAASLLVIVYPHLRGWDGARATNWLNSSVTAQFWFVLFAEALTFGATWWFIRRRRGTLRMIGLRRARWEDGLSALAGFAAYFIAYAVLLVVVQQIFPTIDTNQKQQLGFDNSSGAFNLILTFVSLVVLPPVVEETVFRGFVFTGLRNKLRPLWAALLTSLLFATAHLQFGSGNALLWVAGLDTFTLSLVLCYLRQKTNSLWPGILLHALKNGVAFVTLFIIGIH